MKLRLLLRAMDHVGAGLITWRQDGEHWYCFASGLGVPHVARGATGVEALHELVRFVWSIT